MKAIFRERGKQYSVKEGDLINIDFLESAKKNSELEFNEVLFAKIRDKSIFGAPTIEGAKIIAEVVGSVKGKKVRGIKFKRREKYRKTFGHRQKFTRIKIKSILVPQLSEKKE